MHQLWAVKVARIVQAHMTWLVRELNPVDLFERYVLNKLYHSDDGLC